MKNTIPAIAFLFAFAALAPAADPSPRMQMHEVMYLTPESKRLDKLKELIRRGGDINVPIAFDRMLNAGEDPSTLKPTAWALDEAVQQAREVLVTVLLANGAKLHGGELAKAAHAGSQEVSGTMVAALLLAGADVNSRYDSFTALFWASSRGNKDSVKLLLAQPGIKLDLINNDGDTALMTAVEHTNAEIVEMLVKAGANVSVTNKHGETAPSLAQKELKKQQSRLERQQGIISTLRSPPK